MYNMKKKSKKQTFKRSITLILIVFALFLKGESKLINVPICKFSILNIPLDSPLWEEYGVKLDNFYSVYPELDTNPPYAPTVYLLFDGKNLGVKFFCPKKESPIATSTTRDFNLFGQDGFVVLLDTYNNDRSAYCISINANNVQSDFFGDNAVTSQDPSWDAEWYSKTRVLHNGWEGEIIIPIKILRFNKGEWGFNVMELIKRVEGSPQIECISWTVPKKALIDPSTFGKVKLDVGKSFVKHNIELIPYIAGSYKPFEYKKGIDFGWTLLNNYTINLTYNPDFAQIEGDIDQINLSKTKLWLQEKRPFFMEKGDILNSMLNLMYTRNIEEIKYGGKITGNLKGFDLYSFGVLEERSDTGIKYFCFRAKKSFGKNWLGFYEASKVKTDYYNHGIEGDGSIILPFDSYFDFAIAKTFTKGLPNRDNLAYKINISRAPLNNGVAYNFSYMELQGNYNPEAGFVSLPQIKSTNIYISYIFPIDGFGVQNITPGLSYTNWKDVNVNTLILDELHPSVNINFKRFFNLGISLDKTLRFYNGEYFHNSTHSFYVAMTPSRIFKVSANYMFGKYYGDELKYPSISFSSTPFNNLSFDLTFDYFYTSNINQNERIKVFSIKENWNITKKLSFRTFLQWTDVSKEFQANFLLAYDFFVGSHIYLVWNEIRDISDFRHDNLNLPLKHRIFFVKVCYGIRI